MRISKWLNAGSIVFVLILASSSCKKMTDEHNAITNSDLENSLYEKISNTPELSLFASYLNQTGYDKLLSASGNYTVFAPVNAVFTSLSDPSVLTDPDKLKKLIGNHIAYQLYRTTAVTSTTRIAMVGGKYNNMLQNKIGDANITSADKIAANGILQITNNVLPYLNNCWEFLSTADAPVKQSTYMLSLFQKVFDTTNAVVIGVDPNTGAPIYQPGTDSVFTNLYWNKVYDLRDEKKQYTFFILTDNAWDPEINKFRPYYATSSVDSTTKATSWSVIADFAVEGVYDPATVPDTILSKFNTKVPVTLSQIVKTYKTSNGIVYIMSKIDVQPSSKFKPILIEAENYTGTSHDRRNNTYFRDRFSSVSGKNFRDVLVLNHGVALFNIRYNLTDVPSIRYKAYWVAVNDFQTVTHTQKLGIGDPNSATFAYTTVPLNSFTEVFLGEFVMPGYRPSFNIYLTAANSTTNTANPLVCDYIRLVPVP
ncbi:MAG: fasciclin domain-containing protein [Bacteroidetes bacterium]|nr:MAG: fasciclin domain-containing protein [Bacteroidota bacterium]